MAADLKRSLSISGHRTSLSLEPEFWEELQKAAAQRGVSVKVELFPDGAPADQAQAAAAKALRTLCIPGTGKTI